MKIKIGTKKKTGHSKFPLGTLTAELDSDIYRKMTIEQIAKRLAKQEKIKNGFIEVVGLEFTYEKFL